MEKRELAQTMLKNVIDPELGLNIVDLGLIYELEVAENRARILMTFTTIGCPLSGTLINGVYAALDPLGFDDVKVDVTYTPAWSPDRMTAEGKQRLGIRG